MSDQIKARGWIWELSIEETQWIAVKCMMCGAYATYPARFADGHRCEKCEGGHAKTVGYVRKVRMVKG